MIDELLDSSLSLYKNLTRNHNIDLSDLLNDYSIFDQRLPLIHGTELDGKISSNSHVNFAELTKKYA